MNLFTNKKINSTIYFYYNQSLPKVSIRRKRKNKIILDVLEEEIDDRHDIKEEKVGINNPLKKTF